jgi:hypothetical protein
VRHAAVALEGIDLERHFYSQVVDIVRRGVATGEIRGDVEAEVTARMVWVVLKGLVASHAEDSDKERQSLDDYLITFLFDGIKA